MSSILQNLQTSWKQWSMCNCHCNDFVLIDRKINDPVELLNSLRGIVEIFGESGTGKTQLALFLMAHHLNRSKKTVLYVSIEGYFKTNRLFDFFGQINPRDDTLGDRFMVEHVFDAESLKDFVLEKLPAMISRFDIDYIAIDSIAAAFRTSDSGESKKDLFMMYQSLKDLQIMHNVKVICVNQVAAVMIDEPQSLPLYKEVKPALGLSWTNCIDHQFELSRSKDARLIRCFKSPSLDSVLIYMRLHPTFCLNFDNYQVELT